MSPIAKAILRQARIVELKEVAGLVRTQPPVVLPPSDSRRRAACLRLLLAAERARNQALIEQLKQ